MLLEFFSRPSQKVTYVLRRSHRASFLGVPWAKSLQILRPIAHGLLNEFGRRRSFHGDCTSSHPFVAPLPFGKRSGRPKAGDLARNNSLRPSCETKLVLIRPTSPWDRSRRIRDTPRTEQGPQRSWLAPRSMQSRRKALFCFASSYQRSIQGTSCPSDWHNSIAEAYTLVPRTADHSSNALPREPHRKQW